MHNGISRYILFVQLLSVQLHVCQYRVKYGLLWEMVEGNRHLEKHDYHVELRRDTISSKKPRIDSSWKLIDIHVYV